MNTEFSDADIERYETHEQWLKRQREILDLVQATIDELSSGAPSARRPAPPVLPWWLDGYRWRGELRNGTEALAGFFRAVREELAAALRRFVRSKAAPAFAMLFILWSLFMVGALLFNITARVL